MKILRIFTTLLLGTTAAVYGTNVRCFAPTTCTTDTESYPNWIQVFPAGVCSQTMQSPTFSHPLPDAEEVSFGRQKRSSYSNEPLESLINKETEDRKATDNAIEALVKRVQEKVDIQEYEMVKFENDIRDLVRNLLSYEYVDRNDKGYIRNEELERLMTKLSRQNDNKMNLAALGLCPIAFGNCYIPILEPMNYEAGKEKCADINGKPAKLIDEEHLSYVMRYVANEQSQSAVDIYLGMTASENGIVPVANEDVASFAKWDYEASSSDVISPDNRVSVRINKNGDIDDKQMMISNDPVVEKDGILCEILMDE